MGQPSRADIHYFQVYTHQTPEVVEVANARRHPVVYTDDQGYTCELLAAVSHPQQPWNVAFLRRAKSAVKNGYPVTDVRIWVSLEVAGKEVWERSIASYNPYFGCSVEFLDFFADTLVAIYGSKSDTYALRLNVNEVLAAAGELGGDEAADDGRTWEDEWNEPERWEGWGDFRKIENAWAIVGNHVVTLPDHTYDRVQTLRIDETAEVRTLSIDEARGQGLLPADFDAIVSSPDRV